MSAVLDDKSYSQLWGDRPPVEGAVKVPPNLLAPSKTNPRKHFDAAKLTELAQSVAKHGVLQPILARGIDGAVRGRPQYEIVAGERRWRAAVTSKLASVPVILRAMTDFEVLELQVIENVQRDDLTPLEEADGFKALMRAPNGLTGFATVDELAARLGKSKAYVYARLKLGDLVPDGRKALEEGKINASTALLIARLPTHQQPEAAKKILQGWGGEPASYRQARDLLERDFMLKLGSAVFKITDETLLEGIGSCNACGKRTGANPDLFDDIKSGDVCTDPPCFSKKLDAHRLRLVDLAKEKGQEVITGQEAKKLKPHAYGEAAVITPDTEAWKLGIYGKDQNKTVGQLMGKQAPAKVLFEDPHTKDIGEVYRRDAVTKILKEKGLLKPRASGVSDSTKRAQAKAAATTKLRTAIAERAVAAVALPKFDARQTLDWLMPEVAAAMWEELHSETQKRTGKLLGWDKTESTNRDGRREKQMLERFKALSGAQLGQAFVAMSIAGQMHVNEYYGGDGKRLERIAAGLGVDTAAVGRELAKASPAAKKPVVKKAAAKKPAAKYRNANTGETWSGKGLQPAWVKAALASGKKLADFEGKA